MSQKIKKFERVYGHPYLLCVCTQAIIYKKWRRNNLHCLPTYFDFKKLQYNQPNVHYKKYHNLKFQVKTLNKWSKHLSMILEKQNGIFLEGGSKLLNFFGSDTISMTFDIFLFESLQ